VLLALERDPERRPDSAFELREMLAHFDSVVPERLGTHAPAAERFTPRAQRFLAVGALIAGSALLIGTLWIVSRLVPHH